MPQSLTWIYCHQHICPYMDITQIVTILHMDVIFSTIASMCSFLTTVNVVNLTIYLYAYVLCHKSILFAHFNVFPFICVLNHEYNIQFHLTLDDLLFSTIRRFVRDCVSSCLEMRLNSMTQFFGFKFPSSEFFYFLPSGFQREME